jgi:hypothetical protein
LRTGSKIHACEYLIAPEREREREREEEEEEEEEEYISMDRDIANLNATFL